MGWWALVGSGGLLHQAKTGFAAREEVYGQVQLGIKILSPKRFSSGKRSHHVPRSERPDEAPSQAVLLDLEGKKDPIEILPSCLPTFHNKDHVVLWVL